MRRPRGHDKNGQKGRKGRKAKHLLVALIVAPARRPISGQGANPGKGRIVILDLPSFPHSHFPSFHTNP